MVRALATVNEVVAYLLAGAAAHKIIVCATCGTDVVPVVLRVQRTLRAVVFVRARFLLVVSVNIGPLRYAFRADHGLIVQNIHRLWT